MESLRSRVDRLLRDLGLARHSTVTKDANAIAAAVGVDRAYVLLVVQSAERALYGASKGQVSIFENGCKSREQRGKDCFIHCLCMSKIVHRVVVLVAHTCLQ